MIEQYNGYNFEIQPHAEKKRIVCWKMIDAINEALWHEETDIFTTEISSEKKDYIINKCEKAIKKFKKKAVEENQ